MILLLLQEDDLWAADLEAELAPEGAHLVHYRDPLKALDNLGELRPTLLVHDLRDFPRHWKVLAQDLRARATKEEAVIVLVAHGPVPLDEAQKALHLGVNAVLTYEGDGRALARNVRDVFTRYSSFGAPAPAAGKPGSAPALPFLFRHPRRRHLVTGVLVRYDGRQAVFKADFAHEVADLTEGQDLAGGSLKLAEDLVTLDAVVTRNNGQLQLAIRTPEES